MSLKDRIALACVVTSIVAWILGWAWIGWQIGGMLRRWLGL